MQASLMLQRFRIAIIFAALFFAGCAGIPDAQREAEFDARLEATQALVSEDAVAAAQEFERIARRARDEARQQAWLAAAEAWLTARRPDDAARALDAARPFPADSAFAERALLVAAELDLLEQNPRQALLRLDREAEFSPDEFDRAIKLRGRALYQLGASLEATRLLNQQLEVSNDPILREQLSRLIWQGLSRSREPLTLDQLPDNAGSGVRGWFALGRVGQSAWQDPYGFEARLSDWANRYRGHPAETLLLDGIRTEHQRRFSYPDEIALLLPLNGRYRASAEAVRDGFLAARYQHAANRSAPRISVYDTGADPATAVVMARRAIEAGAQMIVGPLTKEALGAINAADDIDVPVLGLNYLDPADAAVVQENLVQFGLLPEDEAIQVAERAAAEGYRRGVALVPDNEFGLRMTAAFRARFEGLGGELLTVERYRPGEADYSTPIMRMLNLDQSRLRHQQLRSITGQSMEFEPRRRQDVDFIFMAANTEEARLLRPQLRFHQAINLPVYATSHVYRPGLTDRDLDDIRFADMPWILSPDSVGQDVRNNVVELWPGRFERSGRLYALGFDAFRLLPLVLGNDPALNNPLPAMTGLLSLDAQQRIRRDLYWARFAGGKPRLLPQVEEKHSAQGTVHAGQKQ